MVVICEECGKVYKLDAEKLKSSMKGKTSKIKCRVCDHVITISLDDENNLDASAGNIQHVPFHSTEAPKQVADEEGSDLSDSSADEQDQDDLDESSEEESSPADTKATKKKSAVKKKTSGIGLRTKMFFLFLVIPLALMAGSGLFSQLQMLKLANDITVKSTDVVKTLAEDSIINKAKSVASQCSIFLKNNPDLNKDDFYYDLELNRISIQKVGLKGYTALIELPDPDENDDFFIIWCHPDQELIGQPLLPSFKKSLGASYSTFRDVIASLRKGKGASAYYTWTDEKGETKEKFVSAEPIEQSKYMVISTTFIDDFTTPIKNLEKAANKLTENTRNINIVILVALLIIISLSITVYGYRLSRDIGKLTDAADRISVGELDVVIEIKSNDEIGALAEAITRMQDSLRFSIERLRRRR
ncbi:hypothetical protein JCM14469_03900 [Desulfatiferula olefinivorans]